MQAKRLYRWFVLLSHNVGRGCNVFCAYEQFCTPFQGLNPSRIGAMHACPPHLRLQLPLQLSNALLQALADRTQLRHTRLQLGFLRCSFEFWGPLNQRSTRPGGVGIAHTDILLRTKLTCASAATSLSCVAVSCERRSDSRPSSSWRCASASWRSALPPLT